MKRLFLLFAFILLFANTAFANVYDISKLNDVKLVSEYSTSTYSKDMDRVRLGYMADANDGMIHMEWFVLDREDGKALLFAAKNVLEKPYHNGGWQTASTWADSDLREYMNGELLEDELILGKVRNYIYDTKLETYDYLKQEGTIKEENTIDKIFPLSRDEIEKYFNVDTTNSFRDNRVEPIDNNSDFWLRGLQDTKDRVQTYHVGIGGNQISKNFGSSQIVWVRPAMWVDIAGIKSTDLNKSKKKNTEETTISNNRGNINETTIPNKQSGTGKSNTKKGSSFVTGGTIAGLPSRESELRSDNHFYLDNNMQKATWVYYITYYYHVDDQGNIEKSKWVEQRYVGADGRMYRGRKTPDGKWVGDNGLVVDITQDFNDSIIIDPPQADSWWKSKESYWYYFENDRKTTKKGWFHDARDDQWYYLDPTTGIMAVGETNIGGSIYYFNESHDNEPNWYEVGGGFYESYNKKVKAYGSMLKNEQTPDGQYVDENGKLITNQVANNTSNNTTTNNNKFVNSSTTNRQPIQDGDTVLISFIAKYNGQVIQDGDFTYFDYLDLDFNSIIGHYVGDSLTLTTENFALNDRDRVFEHRYIGKTVEMDIKIIGMVRDTIGNYEGIVYDEFINDEIKDKWAHSFG